MKLPAFLDIVPHRMKRVAAISLALCGLAGLIVGFIEGTLDARHDHPVDASNPAIASFERILTHGHALVGLESLAGLAIGLLLGTLFAAWVLSLAYVYADARRRAMPVVPWVLIAFFVPNFLGFLLYFVMRRPLASPCPNCGQPITPEQRFCSWCGSQRPAPPKSNVLGLDPSTPV
jgi:fructose-specific phosphotransferase system IIC component